MSIPLDLRPHGSSHTREFPEKAPLSPPSAQKSTVYLPESSSTELFDTLATQSSFLVLSCVCLLDNRRSSFA